MPTYEYHCDACGHDFEQFQSITSKPTKKCPKCGKNKVRRLISTGAGMIFKGSGFYITDYRDKSYTDKAKAESGGDAKPKAKSDAQPESKSGESKSTETKPDSKPAAKESQPPAKSEPKPAKSSKKD